MKLKQQKITLQVKLVCAGAVLRMANDKDILSQDLQLQSNGAADDY